MLAMKLKETRTEIVENTNTDSSNCSHPFGISKSHKNKTSIIQFGISRIEISSSNTIVCGYVPSHLNLHSNIAPLNSNILEYFRVV